MVRFSESITEEDQEEFGNIIIVGSGIGESPNNNFLPLSTVRCPMDFFHVHI